MIVICYADKWYISLFPAEKVTANHTKAKLFQTEMTRMKVMGQPTLNQAKEKGMRSSTYLI